MKTNKKAQTIVTFYFSLIGFVIFWFMFLGNWLNIVGQQAILNLNAVGLEAFIYGNLNLLVLIALIIVTAGATYFGGRRQ